jgi:hypothetical protein
VLQQGVMGSMGELLLDYFPVRARSSDAERIRMPWRDVYTSLSTRLHLAIGLSCAFSVAVGLMLLFWLKRILVRKQQDWVKRRDANRVLTLLHHYPFLSAHELQHAVRSSRLDREDDDNTTTEDPLDRPFSLITQLLVKPIEQRVVDSVDRFLEERVMRTDG